MNAQNEQPLTTTQAALVLLYANPGATNRVLSLDRDALIVGRSRGCDLHLEAADVSGIHCVITRGAGGFAVRDCGSRAGTRLNGEPVQEGGLRDGDLLQIGPFSFRVQLPAPRKTQMGPGEARQARLERQRRNLTRLALAQRRRVQQLEKALVAGPIKSRTFAELAAKASGLRQRVRDFQQRLQQLEQGERDLLRDRELLDKAQSALEARTRQAEVELSRGRAELAAEAARIRELSRQPVGANGNGA
jgi:pSer/pThr/pTyr-binding forkhead associated (FHA) protein